MMVGPLLATLAACGPKSADDDGDGADGAAITDGATGPASMGEPTGATPTDTGDAPPPPTSTSGEPSEACAGALLLAATQIVYTEADAATTGPGNLEPGTLILLLSNQALTCADPAAALDCPNNSVYMLLLPEHQAPGVYTLEQPPPQQSLRGGNISAQESDVTGGLECLEWASTLEGELEITAIDGASVTGRACVRSGAGGPTMGGPFTALRC